MLKLEDLGSKFSKANLRFKSKCFEIGCMLNFVKIRNNLAAPRPSLGHSQGDSLTKPMLITACYLFRPKGYREPLNAVGSLSPAEHLAGFEPGIF